MALARCLFAGLLLFGCERAKEESNESAPSSGGAAPSYCPVAKGAGSDGSTSQALAGGSDDVYVNVPNASLAKQRAADVVVQISTKQADARCTATLLSPGVLLTANHCITGGPHSSPPWGKQPPFYLGHYRHGSPDSALVGPFQTTDSAVRVEGKVPVKSADDVAISFVDLATLASDASGSLAAVIDEEERPFVADATSFGILLMTDLRHPSFQPPAAAVKGTTWTFQASVFAAAFNPSAKYRQIGGAKELDRANGLWVKPDSVGFRMEGGDSGSPLFQVRSDGTRDVFGVHHACDTSFYECDSASYWVDITRDELTAWIHDHVVDTSRAGPNHVTWRARHPLPPGQSEWWKGDVEYYGPCRQADRDCDHWLDVHDNCVAEFNPFQEDADDDGVGDVCDNCKTTSNPLQENCNREAELAERHRAGGTQVLGDACDPVPCPFSEASLRYANEQCQPNQPQLEIAPGFEFQPTEQCAASLQEDRIKSWTRGSNQGSPAFVPVAVPETTARFCQRTPDGQQPAFRCDRWEIMSDAQNAIEGDAINPDYPWHKLRFGQGSLANPPASGVPLANWSYGVTVSSNTWWFAQDYQSWVTNVGTPALPLPSGDACCTNAAACTAGRTPTTCLDGRLWLHAGPDLGSFGHGDNLANAYLDITPNRGRRYYCPIPGHVAIGSKPSVDPSAPSGILGVPLDPGSVPLPGALELTDTLIVVPASTGLVAALLDDGSGVSLEDIQTQGGEVDCGEKSAGAAFKASLFGAGVRFQNAADPAAVAPGLDAALLGAAVANDGTHLASYATLDQDSVALSGVITIEASNGVLAMNGSAPGAVPSSVKLAQPVLATVPRAFDVIDGNGGEGSATLSLRLGDVEVETCRFEARAGTRCPLLAEDVARGYRYRFVSCAQGAQPNQRLKIDEVSLVVDDGAPNFGPTSVRARLVVFESSASFDLGTTNPSPPPARSGFVSAFSPAAGGTFLVGGTNAAGNPLHDLWFFDRDGVSRELPVEMGTARCGATSAPPAIGRVLASTFSFRTGLWLADEIDTATGPSYRLLRYDSGVVDELARWPLASDTTYLGTSRDGAVLLTRGFSFGFMSEQITLGADSEVSVAARHGSSERLAEAPVVGRGSISYVIESAGHWEVRRIPELDPVAGDCHSIGAPP